jgi:hypothetical protein
MSHAQPPSEIELKLAQMFPDSVIERDIDMKIRLQDSMRIIQELQDEVKRLRSLLPQSRTGSQLSPPSTEIRLRGL